ncbi:unnamed protein product [Penicillium salamii]|uniref:Uncharacterized protein n=1 Tax=Penicillium salamii TaxID=1612424 RepID=A0A9W4N7B3_9EURO|nr:unnamed protein product [Penicillium salamii]CAG8287399.1 unnamed protein product [Penicillium salamii]CAG8420076.1 unnamed protein product [Penicillium salamii]CAG8420610.1 unnamed protein product [Penicillium salamii]
MRIEVNHFKSICFPQSTENFFHPAEIDPQIRSALLEKYHHELEQCSPRETWVGDAHQKSTPYPILGSEVHQIQLQDLSEALVIAITDIVERWWVDTSARFPERMPIEPMEERLLQWMDQLEPHIIRPYKSCQGSWRPDFLLESSDDPEGIENFRICEINARFFSNGFFFTAFGQQALLNMGLEKCGLKGATDPHRIITGINSLFDPALPLHIVKGDEHGFDIHMLVPRLRRYLGMDVKVISPGNLRLIPAASPGGYKLFCLSEPQSQQTKISSAASEFLEEVHQIGLELHQRELLTMSFEMLQQISLRCFNDLRTIFLVHDKRMLGLVREELDSLVARKVLSVQQSDLLGRGLAHTIIPGSDSLHQLMLNCNVKAATRSNYLLKPVRGGKGSGILFGDQVSQKKWLSLLRAMRDPHLRRGKTTHVVQKKIQQKRYDVLLEENSAAGCFPLVGTFHVAHGAFLGLGLWRSGPGRICALSRGGSWMCSVLPQ